MPGPLPNPNAARRNAPTIPTREITGRGRDGPIPDPPPWSNIPKTTRGNKAGHLRAWWDWAWSLPEAELWSDGDAQTLVRLCWLSTSTTAATDTKAMAEARQLEDRLGLSPKSKLDMRVTFTAGADPVDEDAEDEVAKKRADRQAEAEKRRASAAADTSR